MAISMASLACDDALFESILRLAATLSAVVEVLMDHGLCTGPQLCEKSVRMLETVPESERRIVESSVADILELMRRLSEERSDGRR